MYLYEPDETDKARAQHQAVNQGGRRSREKRIGNLGELAFEQFCREYLPIEMWEWKNDDAIRRGKNESYSSFDFDIFGYKADVKTSRDVSAFRPKNLLELDPEDDIIIMVWHRDKEDALILLGWERTETLKSKVDTQEGFSGDEPEKLSHLSVRSPNELLDLGPNTAHMNQKPKNPFSPGDRVVKSEIDKPSVGVVIEVLPPEKNTSYFGHPMDGEAIQVAFPSALDDGPGNWREIHPAKLASYCDDHDVKLYTYKHTNLEFADNPFTPGDYVIKPDYDDPDLAYVASVAESDETDENVSIVFMDRLEEQIGDARSVSPTDIESICEESGVSRYSYRHDVLAFEPQY